MKCAIYCWLLTLCAFQIVYAVTQKELDDACKTYVHKFHSYSTIKEQEFRKEDNKAKEAGGDTDDCEENFNAQIKVKYPEVESDVKKCKNIKTPEITAQFAEGCCKFTNDEFKKWMDKLVKDKIVCLRKKPPT